MSMDVAFATFGLILLMEIGDKSQFAILGLAASSRSRMAVFLGSALALATVNFLGVALGTLVIRLIPEAWPGRIAAVAFIAVGVFILWRELTRTTADEEDPVEAPAASGDAVTVMLRSYVLLFMAELGDKTQFAVIAMTAESSSPLSVFLGATGALWSLTLVSVLTGAIVHRLIPARWLSIGSGVLFVIIGAGSLLRAF